MASSIIPISGKTGTAETYATDASGNSVTTVNLNAVAYATAKDGTKLAVGIMYPHALDWKSKAHQNAVKAIMELYQIPTKHLKSLVPCTRDFSVI